MTVCARASRITRFSGKMLVKGESDASSFPRAGCAPPLRRAATPRGTRHAPPLCWDTTLYIPTAFCAYTGEALDQKTPLLRSIQALNRQALRVLRALGDTETVSVLPTVGARAGVLSCGQRSFSTSVWI